MVWLFITLAATTAMTPRTFDVQFAQSYCGRPVTICLDGQTVETTFAGKLAFRNGRRQWTSVCADVRAPISAGQIYAVQALDSTRCSRRIARAGNIVARFFAGAQSPDQCAGLQLAVWEALEDGGDRPDFLHGRFQARADFVVMTWAQQYYGAINTPGSAVYLLAAGAGGQGGAAGAGGAGQGAGAAGQGSGGQGGGNGQGQLSGG